MRKLMTLGMAFAAGCLMATGVHGLEITGTRLATHAPSGLTVVGGEIELPSAGTWQAVEPAAGARVYQVYLVPSAELAGAWQGERMREVQAQRLLREGQWPLWGIHNACFQYAAKHDQIGPKAFADIDAKEFSYVIEQVNKGPHREGEARPGPYYALIPGVSFAPVPAEALEKRLLAVELHPAVADGQHWVLCADGSSRRVPIDAVALKAYAIVVEPWPVPQPAAPREEVRYRLYGLVRAGQGDVAEVVLRNSASDEKRTCRWLLAGTISAPADDPVVREWANARLMAWLPFMVEDEAPMFTLWSLVQHRLFGTDAEWAGQMSRAGRQNREARTTSVFGVLGGQAALRETLQMQDINAAPAAAGAAQVPVASIPGVQVKSHPFDEMLAGQPGGELALANAVPVDRFMLYVGKPASVLAFLDTGTQFLSRSGALATGRSYDYALTARYLGRLGVDRQWIETLLKSGMVSEMAVVLPDLFLIEGTDMTVVLRIPQLALAKPLLAALKVGDLAGGTPREVATPSGGKTWWAAKGDLLLVGTSRAELDLCLAVLAKGGEGGLGRSAEFRYMLTQLAPDAQTRMYAYFSDPFIRRLVGPAVKIAQLRRLQAKLSLEETSAAGLLYRLDGHAEPPTVERLIAAGYLPGDARFLELTLDADGSARSPLYGTARELASIGARPVENASSAEAAAYAQYVENYSRFWRRFFDPIAMRLDDGPAGELELTTFILPLLDSEMYNGLREILPRDVQAPPLRIPQLEPAPVMMLSFNLPEKAWVGVVDSLAEGLAGFDPAALDSLGPGVHLAIRDSDPVVAIGGGDLLGGLGGNVAGWRGGEMLAIPVALSILTRPCSLIVETRNPQAVREALRRGGLAVLAQRFGNEVRVDFSQVGDRDEWLYAIEVFGMIKIRLGIEVCGDYVVLSTLPWSQRPAIPRAEAAALRGAQLHLTPGAVETQLAALFTAAQDQQRRAAMAGIGCLQPFQLTGSADPAAAAESHFRLLSFRPVHPEGGTWAWRDGILTSTVYGRPGQERQPDYLAGKRDFGALNGIDDLTVGLQIEDTGLRTVCRWRCSPKR